MKNSRLKSMLATGLLVGMLGFANTSQAADSYSLDPMHTSVVWSINHFGFSNPWGKFTMITGNVTLDQQKPELSSLNVTIPMSSDVTGLPKLDEHLASKDFFDVSTYPTATFISTKVNLTGKTTATVTGTLTMHGVSKPETLYVTLNKIGENMMKKQTAGFSATTTVKRSDFGLTAYLPDLGDDVKLFIEAEANLDTN